MEQMQMPEILQMPVKLLPILTELKNYRYFMAEGGRGGGKSQAVARIMLYIAEKHSLRIVCGRETQTNITESVYSILVDLINKHNLNFEIQATKLMHRDTGTTINFRGFREAGRFSIQGLEGVDVLWIDESQAVTKQTLDVLVPTIRKDQAKIIFTMNRHIELDPVYEAFINRDDCLHIHINFDENPYCTDALKKEAAECKKKSLADYDHIWLGQPLALSEDSLFSRVELIDLKKSRVEANPGFGMKVAGFDIARYGTDKCACVILKQMDILHWEAVHVEQWDHSNLNYSTGRILQISNDHNVERSIIDEDGIGAGPLDSLKHGRGLSYFSGFKNHSISYEDNKNYANPRTINAYKLKDLVSKGHIFFDHEDLIKELCTLRYNYDHHQRRILVSKDQMRKDGVRSPNLADALVYAVSLISNVKQEQARQYQANQPPYSKEENLFKIAGC